MLTLANAVNCGNSSVDPIEIPEDIHLEHVPFVTTIPSVDYGLYQNQFRMAFVIITDDRSQVTDKKIQYVSNLSDNFGDHFSKATWGLATVDTSFDLINLESLLVSSNRKLDRDAAIKKFLETNSDDYDFITFFPFSQMALENSSAEFPYGVYPSQYFSIIKNQIDGIGRTIKGEPTFSKKLVGVSVLPTLMSSEDYQLGSSNLVTSGILHETGHRWGIYVGSDFNRATEGLELKQQGIHFYRGLHSPYSATTPMGSNHWVTNGDGTYHRVNEQEPQSYHPIQLYCMGLLNEQNNFGGLLNRKFPIYDCGGIYDPEGNIVVPFNKQSASLHSEVSIADVIKAEGPRTWVENP